MTSALLGTTFIVISQYSTMYSSPKATLKRSCESYGHSILAAVQQDTYYRQLNNFIPTNATRTAAFSASPTAAATATTAIPAGAPYNTYWWAGAVPAADFSISETTGAATNGTVLQSFQLIQGTMRELASIYNNVAGVRCAYAQYDPLTTLAMPADLTRAVTGVSTPVQIRLSPYNTLDGSSACASFPTKVHPAPQGLQPSANGNMSSAFSVQSGADQLVPPAANEEWNGTDGYVGAGPTAMTTGYKMANRGVGTPFDNNSTLAVGIEMSVQVNYMQNGNSETCVVSQKFEYPRDRRAPPKPNIAVASANATNPAVNHCSTAGVPLLVASPTVKVGYDGSTTEIERGTQFLCRDLSWKRVYIAVDTTEPTTSFVPCIKGGVIEPTLATLDLGALVARSNENIPARDFSARVNRWVPCDKLVQCGIAPTGVEYNDGTTVRTNPNNVGNGIHQLQMSYPSLPVGCVMNFEVVAVDTAGNISIAGSAANRVFLENSTAGVLSPNEVLPRTCAGAFCTADVNYPRGYYTCRAGGCCPAGTTCDTTSTR